MQKFVQIMIITWFILASLLILIPSAAVMFCSTGSTTIVQPQNPPTPPATIDDKSAAVYGNHTTSYKNFVDAYKSYVEVSGKNSFAVKYDTIVTKSLVPLLEKVLVAFLAYAFVVGTATVIENVTRLRCGQPTVPFRLF